MDAEELFNSNIRLAYWAVNKIVHIKGLSREEKLSYSMEVLYKCCKYWKPEKGTLSNYFFAAFIRVIRSDRIKELSESWLFNSKMLSLDYQLELSSDSDYIPLGVEDHVEGEDVEMVHEYRSMRDRLGTFLQKSVTIRHNNGESFQSIAEDLGSTKQNICNAYHSFAKKLARMRMIRNEREMK